METEMKETADKLRKSMEQSARLQSEHMTAKEQLSTLEKAKVCVFGGFKTVVRLKPFSKEFYSLDNLLYVIFPSYSSNYHYFVTTPSIPILFLLFTLPPPFFSPS